MGENIFRLRLFDLSQDCILLKQVKLKEITNAEPRVMAKIDSSSGLPDIFIFAAVISILPIKNKEYAIVRVTEMTDWNN